MYTCTHSYTHIKGHAEQPLRAARAVPPRRGLDAGARRLNDNNNNSILLLFVVSITISISSISISTYYYSSY